MDNNLRLSQDIVKYIIRNGKQFRQDLSVKEKVDIYGDLLEELDQDKFSLIDYVGQITPKISVGMDYDNKEIAWLVHEYFVSLYSSLPVEE